MSRAAQLARIRAREACARAKASRRKLIRVLGGKCAACESRRQLQIDHVDGRKWSVSGMSSHTRVRRYWAEFKAGVRLRVLCKRCNGTDGQRRLAAKLEEAPF